MGRGCRIRGHTMNGRIARGWQPLGGVLEKGVPLRSSITGHWAWRAWDCFVPGSVSLTCCHDQLVLLLIPAIVLTHILSCLKRRPPAKRSRMLTAPLSATLPLGHTRLSASPPFRLFAFSLASSTWPYHGFAGNEPAAFSLCNASFRAAACLIPSFPLLPESVVVDVLVRGRVLDSSLWLAEHFHPICCAHVCIYWSPGWSADKGGGAAASERKLLMVLAFPASFIYLPCSSFASYRSQPWSNWGCSSVFSSCLTGRYMPFAGVIL